MNTRLKLHAMLALVAAILTTSAVAQDDAKSKDAARHTYWGNNGHWVYLPAHGEWFWEMDIKWDAPFGSPKQACGVTGIHRIRASMIAEIEKPGFCINLSHRPPVNKVTTLLRDATNKLDRFDANTTAKLTAYAFEKTESQDPEQVVAKPPADGKRGKRHAGRVIWLNANAGTYFQFKLRGHGVFMIDTTSADSDHLIGVVMLAAEKGWDLTAYNIGPLVASVSVDIP